MRKALIALAAGVIAAVVVWIFGDETDDDRAEREADRASEVLAAHRYTIPRTGLVNLAPDDSLFCAPRRPGPTCGGA